MAVIFAGPFDTGNMSQAQWEEVESKLWSNGVINGARNSFAVTTTSGLGVSVNTGDAIVDSFRFYSDTATALTATAADPTNPRIDRVILRVDGTGHTATIVIKAGTPAPSPTPPALTQTTPAGTFEISLAQIRINAGASTIASLTDERTYTAPAIGPNAISSSQIASVLASAVAAGTFGASVVEPAAQVGAGGLPITVGMGQDPSTAGFPGARIAIHPHGGSHTDVESDVSLHLVCSNGSIILSVNAYYDNVHDGVFVTSNPAKRILLGSDGKVTYQASQDASPTAGNTVTWGGTVQLIPAIFQATQPANPGGVANAIWVNTGL